MNPRTKRVAALSAPIILIGSAGALYAGGDFVMEQKMLRRIKELVERA